MTDIHDLVTTGGTDRRHGEGGGSKPIEKKNLEDARGEGTRFFPK